MLSRILLNIKRSKGLLSITDWSGYRHEKSNNGGCYSYSVHFHFDDTKNGKVFQSYSTSSEFPYCNICGCFQINCCEDEDKEYVSMEQIIKLIMTCSKETDKYEIRFKLNIDDNVHFNLFLNY